MDLSIVLKTSRSFKIALALQTCGLRTTEMEMDGGLNKRLSWDKEFVGTKTKDCDILYVNMVSF